jgi:hypothetical protein
VHRGFKDEGTAAAAFKSREKLTRQNKLERRQKTLQGGRACFLHNLLINEHSLAYPLIYSLVLLHALSNQCTIIQFIACSPINPPLSILSEPCTHIRACVEHCTNSHSVAYSFDSPSLLSELCTHTQAFIVVGSVCFKSHSSEGDMSDFAS